MHYLSLMSKQRPLLKGLNRTFGCRRLFSVRRTKIRSHLTRDCCFLFYKIRIEFKKHLLNTSSQPLSGVWGTEQNKTRFLPIEKLTALLYDKCYDGGSIRCFGIKDKCLLSLDWYIKSVDVAREGIPKQNMER